MLKRFINPKTKGVVSRVAPPSQRPTVVANPDLASAVPVEFGSIVDRRSRFYLDSAINRIVEVGIRDKNYKYLNIPYVEELPNGVARARIEQSCILVKDSTLMPPLNQDYAKDITDEDMELADLLVTELTPDDFVRDEAGQAIMVLSAFSNSERHFPRDSLHRVLAPEFQKLQKIVVDSKVNIFPLKILFAYNLGGAAHWNIGEMIFKKAGDDFAIGAKAYDPYGSIKTTDNNSDLKAISECFSAAFSDTFGLRMRNIRYANIPPIRSAQSDGNSCGAYSSEGVLGLIDSNEVWSRLQQEDFGNGFRLRKNHYEVFRRWNDFYPTRRQDNPTVTTSSSTMILPVKWDIGEAVPLTNGVAEVKIPSVQVKARLVETLAKDTKENVWRRMADSKVSNRANKFKVVDGIKQYENDDGSVSAEKIQETFIKIIEKISAETGFEKKDVLELIKQAKARGGVSNEVNSETGKYKSENERSEIAVIRNILPADAKKFSALFQRECKACGIYSGREGGKAVGLRLTFVPDEVVDKLSGMQNVEFQQAKLSAKKYLDEGVKKSAILEAIAEEERSQKERLKIVDGVKSR